MISGQLLDLFANHPHYFDKAQTQPRSENQYIFGSGQHRGLLYYLMLLIGTAMVSRIAKAFQDYFVNVVIQKFGATIFTDGLKHSMRLPYQDFEDQRSGETLSILTKVRTDTEKFISSFVNVFFVIIVSIVFVSIYAFRLHWSIMPVYTLGILFIALVTSLLSKKIKAIQKNIVKETTSLAGTTTESLRNIEIVKSLGLTGQEVTRLNNNTFKILKLELKKVKSIRSLSFIQGTLVNFLQQVIAFTLLWLIFKDEITPGQYLSLSFYGFFLFGPMQEIGNVILSYREAEASLQNFHNLMLKKIEPKPLHPKSFGILEELEFRNVSFQHQTAHFKALDNISFDVKKEKRLHLWGPAVQEKAHW
nr:ABC transporter ATP-binding protein [Niabella ginsengisoli]